MQSVASQRAYWLGRIATGYDGNGNGTRTDVELPCLDKARRGLFPVAHARIVRFRVAFFVAVTKRRQSRTSPRQGLYDCIVTFCRLMRCSPRIIRRRRAGGVAALTVPVVVRCLASIATIVRIGNLAFATIAHASFRSAFHAACYTHFHSCLGLVRSHTRYCLGRGSLGRPRRRSCDATRRRAEVDPAKLAFSASTRCEITVTLRIDATVAHFLPLGRNIVDAG